MPFISLDMIYEELEDYVDDIIVKSKARLEHRATLQRVRQHFWTNNSAEHEALLLGLTLGIELNVEHLLVRGDSLLVIQQTKGEFQIKEAHLVL